MPYSIFLSYRRKNATWFTGRLYDSLKAKYPSLSIFMDVDKILGGEKFKNKIEESINNCTIFIPVLDSEWASIKDEKTNERRLFNDKDFIRFEIEQALIKEKIIIPVLIGNSQMPTISELPDKIKNITSYNAKRIEHESWESDINSLSNSIEIYLPIFKKEFEVFISSPMVSLVDQNRYEALRKTTIGVIKSLNYLLGLNKIYYAGEEIGLIDDVDPPSISAENDLEMIKKSEYFILIYPEKLVTSCLVEAGYAISLKTPSIYFVKNTEDLPYMLKEAANSYEFVHIFQYKNIEHIAKIIEKSKKTIFSRIYNDRLQ